MSGGAVLFKVVKTAQSRERTERTLLWCDPGSSQARFRGRRNAAAGVIRHFDCHVWFLITQVIMPAKADGIPVISGRCTGVPVQRPGSALLLIGR
jgi:hypothetical protein